MIKTVKKFSKKSLAILIALLMIISVMPLTPPISAEAATDTSALSNAISAYENKMNGTIYTNMKDAYNKYILACEAYDAITYGERSDIDVNAVANQLITSTNNMGTYTEPTFNAKVYHQDTTTEAIGGYSNVVYYNGATSWGGQSGTDAWTQKAYVKFKPALPQTLVLVDNGGTDNVYSPAVIQVNNGDTVGAYNKSKTFRYIKLNSTPSSSYYSVNLKQNWDMGVVAWDSWVDPSTIESAVNHIQNSTDRSEAVNDDNNRLACNRLYFSAKTSDGDTSDYYEKLSVSDIKFGVDVYSTWQNAIFQNKSSEESGEVYSNGTYYILNYRPIKTKLLSAKTNLTNALNGKTVSSYKEGGLDSLLELIDKCTADNVDPTKCAYSSGVETAVTTCANNIKTVDKISVPNVTEDSNQTIYGNLKTEIVTYNTIIANNTYNNHQLSDYTDDSIADAKTALNEAKNFMKTVYTNGYADSSTATSKYNAMVTAKEGLTLKSYKVTFKYADGSVADEKVYTIGTLASNITKPNNTASNYDNAKHYSYSWPDLANVTADVTYNELKSEAEHSFTSTVTKNPDCTSAGVTTYTCACGYSYTTNEPAATGVHNYTQLVSAKQEATCTTPGKEAVYKCATCDLTTGGETIDKLGHDMQVVEGSAKAPTCTVAGKEADKACSRCDYKETGAEIPALGHDYKYAQLDADNHTVTCSRCDYEVQEAHNFEGGNTCTKCLYEKSTIDTTAYDNAVEEYEAIIGADDYAAKYTEASRTSYQEAVEAAKKESFATKEQVDAAVAAILSAKTKLVYAQPEIKFVEVDANGIENVIETKNYTYGTPVEFTKDADNIAKWIVKTQNGNVETKVATSQTTYTMIATEPATVYVHLTEEKTESVQYSKVSFISKNGAVSSVQYLEVGKSLDTSKVPKVEIPFYKFVKWNKALVTADGNDIEVKAVYDFIGTEENKCRVHYEGFENGEKEYTYDSFVYLFGAEDKTLALASDTEGTNIITYLNENAFYAPHTADIYVITVAKQQPSIGITGSYASSTDTKKTAAFNCKFFLPAGCTVVEYGLTATSSTGKSIKIKAEAASARGEYCVKVSMDKTSTVTSVEGVAYLTYKDADNNLQTIHSTPVTQNL